MDSNDQIIGPTVDDCYLTISADRTTITEGDNVQFTVSHVGDCPSSPVVNIYVNDSIVYSGQLFNNSLSYVHFFTEPGEFIVYANTDEFIRPSKSIEITVEEATIELPTSQVSWEINNKNVQSIEINNKEVKSIITSNGKVLYSKEEDAGNILKLQFRGSNFSTYSDTPFTYMGNVFVDWGDDTGLIEYTGGKLSHSYSANETYTIKIYGDITSLNTNAFNNRSGLTSVIIPNGVTSLGDGCFGRCYSLTSVIIPDSVTTLGDGCFNTCARLISIIIPNSVTSLGEHCFEGCSDLTSVIIPDSVTNLESYCFYGCSNLTNINLNWNTSNKILTYDNTWIMGANSNLKFNIPNGTTSLYISKNYPSNKLMEIGNISLSSDKNILSYYDNDTATLSATVTSSNNEPMSGVTVEFFNGSTSMGTATTNSSGIATKTYASSGSGDVSFTAIVGTISSETYELHDIYFYRGQEYSLTKSSGSVLNQAFDSNVALTFPSHCEISFEIYSTGGTSSNEHRLFIQPNSLYVVGTQPSKALFVQNNGTSGSNGAFGYRNSTTNTFGSNFSGFSTNEYHNVKFVRNGTSVTCYFDDAQKGSGTISFFDNYTDWNFYFHLWNNGTMKIQNIQIKPLFGTKYSSTEESTDELSGSELDP